MAAQLVADQGHVVVLHARNEARAEAARRALPAAADVLIVDLSTIASMRELAARANAVGRFDAVIHNVGIGYQEPHRVETADGLSLLWAVNVLAPYVLTAAMHRPDRLVYLSSGLSRRGNSDLDDLQWANRPWHGTQAYCDTKLHEPAAHARHRSPLAGRAVERGRAGMGADQNGRPASDRRPVAG